MAIPATTTNTPGCDQRGPASVDQPPEDPVAAGAAEVVVLLQHGPVVADDEYLVGPRQPRLEDVPWHPVILQ